MRGTIRQFSVDVWRAYWTLLRIMLPALLIVRVLSEFGFSEWLAHYLSPLMSFIGLPSEFSLVWAVAMLTNIYTAMAVFYQLADGQVVTVAQVSCLGILVLMAHALPVEGAVAKYLRVPWRLTLLLRVFGGYCLAWLCFVLMRAFDLGNQEAFSLWQPELQESGWLTWLLELLKLCLTIFVILAALMGMLRILKALGVERLIAWCLSPLLKLMGLAGNAANVTIIGLLLGLSFGAGLLMEAGRSGEISKRDMQVVACFLSMCHSIVEDTLLILLLGADIWPILIGRLLFTCCVIYAVGRWVYPNRVGATSSL